MLGREGSRATTCAHSFQSSLYSRNISSFPYSGRSAFPSVQQPSSQAHRRLLADNCKKLKTVSKPTR